MKQGCFPLIVECGLQAVERPGAGKIWRRRGPQLFHISQNGGERFRIDQPLRPGQAKGQVKHDENGKTQKDHDTLNPGCRQHQNDHQNDQRTDAGGRQTKRHQRQQNIRIEKQPGPIHGTVCRQHRQGKDHHHPGTVHRTFDPPGQKQRFDRNRQCMNQVEILAQIEFGQGR